MLWYQSIPVWFQNLFPHFIWQIPGESNKDVYLTFDDGPHPEISLWVAEQLERYQMKATFFCVGDNASKFPDVLNTLKTKGHQIGNHTMHHLKGWNTNTEDYIKDVEACSELIHTDVFRPPYGRLKNSQANLLIPKYRIIMWSVLACDFNPKLNTESALKGLKYKTRNGSIVVFHDSVKAEKNLRQMLPPYLDYLNEKGFICKTL